MRSCSHTDTHFSDLPVPLPSGLTSTLQRGAAPVSVPVVQVPVVPSAAELVVEEVVVADDRICIRVACCRRGAPCPKCGRAAERVHSRYTRRLADLPWQGVSVSLEVTTRKFYCRWRTCRRRIFTERLPQTTVPYGRRTLRAGEALAAIGLIVGARPGARLATQLSMVATADIILRRLRRLDVRQAPTPRVLGVDDWAWAKRKIYGTILCDLDRGGEYARAARSAAPHAIQIADRFHLLKNLTDAMTRVVSYRFSDARAAYAEACASTPDITRRERGHPGGAIPRATLAEWQRDHGMRSRTPKAVQLVGERRERRLARYTQVCELHAAGMSDSAIVRMLGLDRRTVRKFWSASAFPERVVRTKVSSATGPFRTYLRDRVAQGCLNAATLFREIHAQGYTGRAAAVRIFVAGLRPAAAAHLRYRRTQPPSPEQTVWLLYHASHHANSHANNHVNDHVPYTLNERESHYVRLLVQGSAAIAQAVQLGDEFARMLKARDMNALRPWLAAAETSPLKGFAQSLRQDFDAVLAALCFRWSQGPVEGNVHRLKSVKRTMYGRGSFELLRQRVLYKPPD